MIKKKSIRLYLDEPKDRVVYDRIRSIGESKRMSENRFMIDAIYQYIKLTGSVYQEDHTEYHQR